MSIRNAPAIRVLPLATALLVATALAAADVPHFAGVISQLTGGLPSSEIVPDVPIDAIPPLIEPAFLPAAATTVIEDTDFVLGVAIGDEAFAYPFKIMNFHEIVEHTVGGQPIIATFCPLTNSGVILEGGEISFGNTGALYERAMVMSNHETESDWEQAAGRATRGPLTGAFLETIPSLITTWGEWSALFPNSRVLSTSTGHVRDYSVRTQCSGSSGSRFRQIHGSRPSR